MERKYYLATPGGKSEEAVRAWQKMHSNACDRVLAFCKSVGCTGKIVSSWRKINAFEFDHDPGRDWKRIKRYDDAYFPSKSTKEGKTLIKQIEALGEMPDGGTFARLINGPDMVISGGHWSTLSFQVLGDSIVVSVPVKYLEEVDDEKQFVPPDARELKMSEYYALKERAEEAKRAAS